MVVPTNYVSFYLFYDFKSYFSERNFAVVPTFKKSIYKVQIPTFFRIMSFLRPAHVKKGAKKSIMRLLEK
ncbi:MULTISPECIES: hypothetical protein [Leptospira]|uniref:Uncharacterized protein n=1 Tax=Leptospira kirschneri serovar Pomona TaxID=561005 RepID=A0A1T1DI55_9LEPT|nr:MULTISPECIES: hypothetical protein [Leptospira]KXZ29951.1 hypothetical protein AYB32_08930 [Leptospira kirschneri]KXZ32833.1 hypothetical protein AYB34_12770 [Leptospira sp. ZV016]OOV40544.1 hypothetical protein B1J93_17330 [Leptospira kirschneri serovar Pomona]